MIWFSFSSRPSDCRIPLPLAHLCGNGADLSGKVQILVLIDCDGMLILEVGLHRYRYRLDRVAAE